MKRIYLLAITILCCLCPLLKAQLGPMPFTPVPPNDPSLVRLRSGSGIWTYRIYRYLCLGGPGKQDGVCIPQQPLVPQCMEHETG